MRTHSTILAAAIVTGIAGLASAQPQVTLKDAYKGDFVVGAAINTAEITGQAKREDAIVTTQFDSISPENALKWQNVHPKPGTYDFSIPDQYVAFGIKNHMYIVGHVLLWHNQTPDWVFHDDKGNLLDRDALLARLRRHIMTVVGRYKGKINAWDVVNEVLDDNGGMRQTLWSKIIGPDYIAKAFEYAHKADPNAELTYNDYNIESGPKHQAAVALVQKLKAEGVPITTVGIQGHYILGADAANQLDAAIADFGKLGVKVAISELDIDVLPRNNLPATADIKLNIAQDPKLNPYVNGLPLPVQQDLANHYAEIFDVCLKHRGVVERVTLWGVTDADSWHNNWPIRGRTAYSLLFDRNDEPKLAFDAVIKAAGK